MGCSKCCKEFLGTVGEKRDYSGFDLSKWTKRTGEIHRTQMTEILKQKTKTDKESKESEYGTRYSCLVRLPYYDSVRYAIIDPMHNLFLGSAKRMISVWKDEKFLNDDTLALIQERVDKASVPSDVGKLPGKIDKFTFQGFTADELKNWTILFSLYALKGILPKKHIECWRYFVLACRFLCNTCITNDDLNLAHSYLIKFCKQCELLYGKTFITPNMHLHGHLKECILDFGPIYSFWCFSFERFNGLLGSYPTNKKNIEVQMMNRFYRDSAVTSTSFPDEYYDTFSDSLSSLNHSLAQRGSLNEVVIQNYSNFQLFSSRFSNVALMEWHNINGISFSRKFQKHDLSALHHTWLKDMYTHLYPDYNIDDMFVPDNGWKTHECYRSVKMLWKILFSRKFSCVTSIRKTLSLT